MHAWMDGCLQCHTVTGHTEVADKHKHTVQHKSLLGNGMSKIMDNLSMSNTSKIVVRTARLRATVGLAQWPTLRNYSRPLSHNTSAYRITASFSAVVNKV